jgi:hypothetical protein
MKRVALLCIGLAMIAVVPQKVKAQDILTEVYTREHIPNKSPVPYAYVREADVMWAKDIYRIIDLIFPCIIPPNRSTTGITWFS